MSVHSSPTGMINDRPMARAKAGLSAVPVGHAIDLAFFFPDEVQSRPDALIVETRRHLGGCIAAIEMALRLSLDHAPDIAAALDHWPAPLAWSMIRAQPTLLGSDLLAHMQMRAGVTLMLRQFGQADVEQFDEGQGDLIPATDDPELGRAVSALALAEGRWLALAGEDAPMKPDLPAEHFADLLWTVAACLHVVSQRTMVDGGDRSLAAFDRSGWALLRDHDEAACPIAQADRLVRGMGERADAPELLGALLGQRRFLLFAAVAARRLRMGSQQLVAMLVMGPVAQLANLCRALGGSAADYRILLLALRPVRPLLSDAAIVAEAERYQGVSEEQADSAIGALRTSSILRAKLDHLRTVAGT
ncbi:MULTISPECIES: hypothetical protein [Sphingobium]|jgi:hypothetical protein|uniref:hypothetical protein n=1 Tax=Sphingobium TaxID=165695 RepID=UPI000E75545B|nr:MULTISPECIES: hypothetical protein [Sphingobium]KAA9017918.1 DUF2336 domain-containing protein [Sphingobium limneticum]MBU0932547.1 DUF2336 domain-containing protein [Alphaproteobacteria bacterium]